MAKKQPQDMTVEEWVAELTAISRESGDGMTSQEIAAMIGRSTKWVRERLLAVAKRLGVLRVGRRTAETVSGLTTMVPVYRFIRKGTKV